MRRLLLRVLVYGLLALFLVSLIAPFPLKICATVLIGWVGFLGRTLPNVTVSWSGIGMGFLCSMALLLTLHSFCSWFVNARNLPKWRWSASLAIYGLVWSLFLATMGVTGIVHQLGWLAASDEKWIVRKWFEHRHDLTRHAFMVSNALATNDSDPIETQRDYRREFLRNSNALPEAFHVVFFPPQGQVTNAVVFHRDPAIRDKIKQFAFVNDSGGVEVRSWDEITQFIPDMERRTEVSKY